MIRRITPRGSPRCSIGADRVRSTSPSSAPTAADSDLTDRVVWRLPLPPRGLGCGITTYRHDGNPLPPYAGDPLWLPLRGNAEAIADAYWDALDAENKIALAVKIITAQGSHLILRQPD